MGDAYDEQIDGLNETIRRLRGERDEALRRALGHAYAGSMAEGAEDIVRQELARERREHAETRGRVSEVKTWARSRITACREQERKFADAWPESHGKGPPQALVEAWTERRALQAVLEQFDAEAAPTGGTE